MAQDEKLSFGHKLLLAFVVISICYAVFKSCSSEASNRDNDSVNLDNVEDVRQFVQGKWSESLPSSVPSETMYFRLLTEGNKVTIYTKMGFNDWDMSTPAEIHTVEIGEKTHQVDGIPCRYLYWDEETLLTRSISTLHVTDCCILFSGSVRPLTKGWE